MKALDSRRTAKYRGEKTVSSAGPSSWMRGESRYIRPPALRGVSNVIRPPSLRGEPTVIRPPSRRGDYRGEQRISSPGPSSGWMGKFKDIRPLTARGI